MPPFFPSPARLPASPVEGKYNNKATDARFFFFSFLFVHTHNNRGVHLEDESEEAGEA
jgi:hypothetical protein